jgi:MerR family copper efflux transcriptional regulator
MWTIGQVASAVGVATSTIRYYEREGLLPRPPRTAAGYRLYDPSALERLRFIRTAQSVGFSLEDVRALLALDHRSSCNQVQRLIEARLADVLRRIGELEHVRDTLAAALDRCRKSGRGCPVLRDFRKPSRRESRTR